MGREDCCGGEERSQQGRRYVPAAEVGEYEEFRKKKKPSGPLYPLDEEGTYGAPPSALPPPLPGYTRRERKPKVYASYAVSSDCEAHGEKLSRAERGSSVARPRPAASQRGGSTPRPARRASSFTPQRPPPAQHRSSSQPRQSVRLPSPSPSQDRYDARPNWKNSLRSSESPARSYRPPARRSTSHSCGRETPVRSNRDSTSPARPPPQPRYASPAPAPDPPRSEAGMSGRSSQSSTDWGYTSYENYSAGRKSSSSSRQTTNREAFDESYEEFGTEAVGRKMALASLKTPEINPWDNMGILGLSSKMFSDSSSSKVGMFSSSLSSSSILRRESVTSHVM